MIRLLRLARLAVILVLAAGATACDFGKTTGPTSPDQSNISFSTTDITVGTGAVAATGTTASVSYGAWLYSDTGTDHKGTQVDQGQTSFVIGGNQVISGFDRGVNGMKVGGTRRVIVPPSLAYGSTGYNTIPPNAALVFDIALVNVVAPTTATASSVGK